jgi:hypothetical protein
VRTLTRGLIAGAAGTLALEAVSYLDMALLGRPPSMAPQQSVRRIEEAIGVDLGKDGAAYNRRAAIGALLGYATGLAVAVAYAAAVRRPRPRPEASAQLASAAMLAANLPMTAWGITDPRRWTPADWLADIAPHLAYGAVAAAVDDLLREQGWP